MTDLEKQALNLIEGTEELCKYCPWIEGSHSPLSLCEGCYCDEAKENYLDELHLQNQ